MIASTKSVFRLLLLCLIMCVSANQVQRLQCYFCQSNNNASCANELRDCPKDQAYDRCITTIYKNPRDGVKIKKGCALAPCTLSGIGNLNFANFKSDCESMAQDCTYCCAGDGCNKDAASSLRSTRVPLLCLTLLLVAYLHRKLYHF